MFQDTQNKRRETTFYDLINTLSRKKWLVLLCLCGVLAPIIYYNQTAPPVYEAEASIVFEETKEPIPAFDFSQVLYRKSFITNQIEEIKSRTLSEEVANALPESVMRTFKIPNPHLPYGLTKEKFVARRIRRSISAEPVRDTDIIKIKTQANDPMFAAIIANTVTDVLKERRLKIKREEISGVRKFIEVQLETVREQLLKAEQNLRDFKEKNRVTSLDQESEELLRRMTEAEVLYNEAKTEREKTGQRLDYVHKKIAEQRKEIVPSITGITSPWAHRLKSQLVELEVQYSTLQIQDYPQDHPQLIRLKEQIDQTKQSLTKEMLKIAEGENIIEPLSQIQNFLEESVSLGVDLHTYRAKEDALKKIVDSYDKKLQTLPEKELQLAQLTRAREVNNSIYMMLMERGEEARITEAGKISNIRVIDLAEPSEFPIRPRKRLNLILGIIVGLTVGIGLAFFTESLDTSLKTIEDVEGLISLPVLGLIPTMKKKGKAEDGRNQVSDHQRILIGSQSHLTAPYQSVCMNIRLSSPDKPLKTLLVTSPGPKEGKSVTTANLGIASARLGTKTLLIDADLRRPMLNRLFDEPKEPGLTDVLIESTKLSSAIHKTEVDNLWVITCGTSAPNPVELISSQRMKNLLKELEEKFDLILLDSPPTIAVADSVVLGTETDGVTLVIESGKTSKDAILRTKALLENVNSKIVGAVLNNVQVEHLYGRYGHYNYYYRYYTHEGTRTRKRERRKKA